MLIVVIDETNEEVGRHAGPCTINIRIRCRVTTANACLEVGLVDRVFTGTVLYQDFPVFTRGRAAAIAHLHSNDCGCVRGGFVRYRTIVEDDRVPVLNDIV